MQKYAHLNRAVKMGTFIYQSRKKVSYTVSLEKKGLIVYLAALKKGAIRAAHPYHVIYIGSYPPPWFSYSRLKEFSSNRTKQRQSFAFFSLVNISAQPALECGVRNPHTWTPCIIIRTKRV